MYTYNTYIYCKFKGYYQTVIYRTINKARI